MFPKFQTPLHLKIDLDQVHFMESNIKKTKQNTFRQQQKNIKMKHKNDFYHQATSQSLLS